ncbi:MAG: hypothetical protein LBS58_03030, partial [Coriobacteriales bacterium]|nr:hypothetical protein [Coriobacteriales bacterium]
ATGIPYAKEALRPLVGSAKLTVRSYGAEAPEPCDDAILHIVFAAHSPATGMLVAQVKRMPRPLVIVSLQPRELIHLTVGQHVELDPADLLVAAPTCSSEEERYEGLFTLLGEWVVRTMPDERLALARAFGFIRAPLAIEITKATALQNGAIAAVFFIPGADLPVITLNQAKMLLEIAAAYDLPLGTARIKELAVLLAGAFGCRALARRLIGVIPVLGWAIRGAIGYTATIAVGTAAREYFSHAASPQEVIDDLKGRAPDILERIKGALPHAARPRE